jgi:hypothetical protein
MTSACIHHIVLATVQIIGLLRHNAEDSQGFLLHYAVESFLKNTDISENSKSKLKLFQGINQRLDEKHRSQKSRDTVL